MLYTGSFFSHIAFSNGIVLYQREHFKKMGLVPCFQNLQYPLEIAVAVSTDGYPMEIEDCTEMLAYTRYCCGQCKT